MRLIRGRPGRNPLRYCPHVVSSLAVCAKLMVGRTALLQDELAMFNFAQAPRGDASSDKWLIKDSNSAYFHRPVS